MAFFASIPLIVRAVFNSPQQSLFQVDTAALSISAQRTGVSGFNITSLDLQVKTGRASAAVNALQSVDQSSQTRTSSVPVATIRDVLARSE